MPSSTAIVLNSLATPPASDTASATIMPRLRRCTCPGTNWVKLLAIATIGLPKSSSVMPVARHRAPAPAMVRPWVEVRERSSGIPPVCHRRPNAGSRRPVPVHAAGRRPVSARPSSPLPNGRLIRQSVTVHPPSGVEWAALASLLVAVPAVALLAFSGRRHTGAARRAHMILAAGGAVVVGAALAGLLSAVLAHPGRPGDPHPGRLGDPHGGALGSA